MLTIVPQVVRSKPSTDFFYVYAFNVFVCVFCIRACVFCSFCLLVHTCMFDLFYFFFFFFFFFFFLIPFYVPFKLFHSYRDESIGRWGENRSTRGKTT